MKRVIVASFQHESNGFNPIVTGKENFRVIYGTDVYSHLKANCPFSGIIETLQNADVEVLPTVFAGAVPNGEIDDLFFYELISELMKRIEFAKEEGPIDSVTLALHGSMRVKGVGAAEGTILTKIKDALPTAPVFVSLDMHATITDELYRLIDGVAAYKTAPHIDRNETGALAASMTLKALHQEVEPFTSWIPIPLLVAGEQSATTVEPMASLVSTLIDVEAKADVWAASYVMGFPWADTPDSRAGVMVTAATKKTADEEAVRLARLLWERRGEFAFETEAYEEAEALDLVFEAIANGADTPIYLSDSGDNPTAGSSGDCTGFLRRLISDQRVEQLNKPVLYGGIYDPEATRRCRGQVGEKITLTFGASFDQVTSSPLTATGLVKGYVSDWQGSLVPSDLALIQIGNVDVVLASGHIGFTGTDVFEDLGADPAERPIVVCKLGYLTPEHKAHAKRSILVLTKGSTNEDLPSLPYKHVPRPLYPLDSDTEFSPEDWLKSPF
ncbi:MAG TPA: M81 family metallopeptidase [Fastidiosipila sp.]|nr:M81 family metallopeptidase [Fastidiosipila sp.]